jgi:hypothetical protein
MPSWCLAVMQVLLRFPSERHWLRYARKHLAGGPGMMFPYLPDQDGYNKRMRKAGPLLAKVMRHLATRSPSWWDQLRLIDSTPVPCAASRETVKRSDLAGDGFAGHDFETFITDTLGAHFARPDRKNEPTRFGNLARVRNGSKRSSTPSRVNSTSRPTADAPWPGSTPASPNDSWP